MAPFFRGLVALFLVLGEPLLPFDPLVDETTVALLVTTVATLLPLLAGTPRIPPRLRALLPLAGFFVTVVVAGWVALLERTGLGNAPLLGAGFLFGPYVVSEAAHALAEFRLLPPSWKASRESGVVDDARGTVLGVAMPILPYVIFLLYLQVLHMLVGAAYWIEIFPSLAIVIAGSFLLFAFASAPFVLPPLLGARPLEEGALRTRLLEVASASGFRPREIHCWRAAGGAANAFVVGILPRGRSVFLSEGLLAALDTDEVAAVFAHEMGHVKRGHFLVYGGLVAAFLLLPAGWESTVLADASAGWGLFGGFVPPIAFFLGFWGFLFPWASRRLERDADLYAAARASAIPRALLRVAAWNHMDPEKKGWRHFSIRRRLEELAWVESPEGVRHRREVASIRVGVVLLVLAGATVWGWGFPDEIVAGEGRHAFVLGELPRAETLLREALERRPHDATATMDLGRTLLHRGRLPEAVARIREALALSGDGAHLYFYLCRDFWQLGAMTISSVLAEEYRVRSLGTRGDRRDLSRRLTAVQTLQSRPS